MSPRVGILDYGVGNTHSISRAFGAIGCEVTVSARREELGKQDVLVLPGMGAFSAASEALFANGLDSFVKEFAGQKKVIGICLGMQLLFDSGEEGGTHRGLGLFPGQAARMTTQAKLPHIGWNRLLAGEARLRPELLPVLTESEFYFSHSYVCQPKDPRCVVAYVDYAGVKFPAVVSAGNVIATQFHPEKSRKSGLQLLRVFLGLEGKA